jgi:hypothetical protein
VAVEVEAQTMVVSAQRMMEEVEERKEERDSLKKAEVEAELEEQDWKISGLQLEEVVVVPCHQVQEELLEVVVNRMLT